MHHKQTAMSTPSTPDVELNKWWWLRGGQRMSTPDVASFITMIYLSLFPFPLEQLRDVGAWNEAGLALAEPGRVIYEDGQELPRRHGMKVGALAVYDIGLADRGFRLQWQGRHWHVFDPE